MAEKLCALTVGGAYFGTVDGFERSAELDPADNLAVEFLPLSPYAPVRFVLGGELLLSPPPQVEVYHTREGAALFVRDFFRLDQSMRVIWQTALEGARLTLLLQGRVQLHLETEAGFFIVPLPDAFEKCTARACGREFLLESESAFVLINRRGEIAVRAEGHVTETGNKLCAEVPLRDSLGHTALCTWEEGKLSACTLRAARGPDEATFALALFEGALIGADLTPFLHEELLPKAEKLRDFLGGYTSVTLTDAFDCVGLVYPRTERVFDVRYFRVFFKDGKICNLKEE